MLRSLFTRQRSLLKEQTGFSAIEILVALAVVGILAKMAAPGIVRTVEMYRLRGATLGIYAAMQHARMAAVAQNNRYAFSVSGSTYIVHDDDDNDGVQDPGEILTTKNLNTEAKGVTISTAGLALIFRPDGTIVTPPPPATVPVVPVEMTVSNTTGSTKKRHYRV